MPDYNLKSIFKAHPRENNENISLAVLTSGGDSQGMNAAVRSVVRVSTQLGIRVYLVYEGYYGLIEGEKYIKEAGWFDVSSILGLGGTVIGTKRCKEFMTREGRIKAAKNMISFGISNLVVIGGDGSLTGANVFREEWSSYIEELLKSEEIDVKTSQKFSYLNVVGIVGSIDNDFSGTDMTIGANTALHRILEAIDSIVSTAFSHQRTFIMEIMGRTCGYLAIMSALMCEADYLFIREWPQELNWPEKLCRSVTKARTSGKRLNIIIVSEGAVDINGNSISSEMVKNILVDSMNHDARITVLGHVQRGGSPSAFDRILASRMGARAVLTLLKATDKIESKVMCLKNNSIVDKPLMECVTNTKEVAKAIEEKDFEKALKLRGSSFTKNLDTYKQFVAQDAISNQDGKITLIMNIGGSSNGINALTYSIVRSTISSGNRVFGAKYGIEGLIRGEVSEILWSDVIGWLNQGGVKYGITRMVPDTKMLETMAEQMKRLQINSCVIAGGLEAVQTGLKMYESREKFEEFCIPIIVVPVTSSNNIPATDFTLGTDTALNQVVKLCDILRQSAEGHKSRVFVVEVLGGYCGYLTSMASIACGADASYISEEIFTISDLMNCIYKMAEKFHTKKITRGLVLRSERAHANFTTSFITKLFTDVGKNLFTTRSSILGNIASGGVPSPYDRSYALKKGLRTVEWINKSYEECPEKLKSPGSAVLLCYVNSEDKFTPLKDLRLFMENAEKPNYHDNEVWWLTLRPLMRMLESPKYWKMI